jgi:hypothetical protein
MRTTLTIDDDLLEAARSIARSENRSIGKVISDLARRGLAPRSEGGSRSGFPVFQVDSDVSPITSEMVRRAAEDPQ